jgi:hypothetical protein
MDWLIGLLNSPNAPLALCVVLLVFFVCVTLSRRGLLGIHTKYVTIGATSKEDMIKLHQKEAAYLFIMSLASKVDADGKFNGYKTKYILELVYDEVIDWIFQNHMSSDDEYIKIKQDKLRSVVYNVPDLQEQFKTREFAERMDRWAAELIDRLIRIRSVYSGKKWEVV